MNQEIAESKVFKEALDKAFNARIKKLCPNGVVDYEVSRAYTEDVKNNGEFEKMFGGRFIPNEKFEKAAWDKYNELIGTNGSMTIDQFAKFRDVLMKLGSNAQIKHTFKK